jgi:hypothetical protein
MALTDECLGLCEAGFRCDRASGECIEDPCDGACAEGYHCEGSGEEATCVAGDGGEASDIASRLDRLFEPRPGFGGGDGACSVDLGDGQTLWLLNDTWIGPVTEGRRGPNASIVHNAIGLWSHESEPGEEQSVLVHHGGSEASPRAWVTPPGAADADPRWYWLADGLVLPDSGQLALFAWEIERKGEGGTWDFQRRGSAVMLVDHPDQPLTAWQPRITPLPFSVGPGEVAWGAEIVVDPDANDRAHVFVFGTRAFVDPPSRDLLVARVASAEIEHTDAWRFWNGTEWAADVTAAAPIASGLTDELSVHLIDDEAGVAHWILLHSDPTLGPDLLARVAPGPLGPYSAPRVLGAFEAPELPGYFTYGAKGHDHLSEPGDLLVSFVVNHEDFATMASDTSIYRPRFVAVPLESALEVAPRVELVADPDTEAEEPAPSAD